MRIARNYEISSAHLLPNHKGKCQNLHGHNYEVEVVVAGTVNSDKDSPEYGMVIDFDRLDRMIEVAVLNDYDHWFLNEVLDYPTAERVVADILDRIEEPLKTQGITTVTVKVHETLSSWAEDTRQLVPAVPASLGQLWMDIKAAIQK